MFTVYWELMPRSIFMINDNSKSKLIIMPDIWIQLSYFNNWHTCETSLYYN